jgi:hypothetical protein
VPGIAHVTAGSAFDDVENRFAPAAEWDVEHHRDTAVGGRRQQPFRGKPVAERVVELHDLHVVVAHEALHLIELIVRRDGSADVTEFALPLPLAHDGQLALGVDEVVHQHGVDHVGLHSRQGLLESRFAAELTADVRLRCEEQPVANVEALSEVADHGLGRAVDHRRVHDLAAELDETRHGVTQRRPFFLARADAVAIRAYADRRKELAALRDAFLNQLAVLRERVAGAKRSRCSKRSAGSECLPSRDRHRRTPACALDVPEA